MLNVRALPLGILVLFAFCMPALAADAGSAPQIAGDVVSVDGVVFIRQDGRPDGRQSGQQLKPARPGDHVVTGDVINTASNGKIKILMKDKSIVDLGPSALFKVDHYSANSGNDRQVDVSMMYGTVRTAVTQKIEGKGRFKIRTPTATMGVRGTEFIVKSEVKDFDQAKRILAHPERVNEPATAKLAAKTEVTVVQGKVEVAKKEVPKQEMNMSARKLASVEHTVMLTAGMQVSSTTGTNGAGLSKPVTIDTKSLAAMASVAKIQDNTFTKAVVIDIAQQGGGDATRSALASFVSTPPPAPVTADSFHDIPGTFGSTQALNPPTSKQNGVLRRVHVSVVTQ